MPAGFPVVQRGETMSHHLTQSTTQTHHCQYVTTINVVVILQYDASCEHVSCSLPAHLQHMEPVHHHCLSHTHGTPSAAHIIYDFQQVGILTDWESESLLSDRVWIDSQSVMPFLSCYNAGTSYLPSQLCCSTQGSACLFTDSCGAAPSALLQQHHVQISVAHLIVTVHVLKFCLATHKTTYLFTIPRTLWKSIFIIFVIKKTIYDSIIPVTHTTSFKLEVPYVVLNWPNLKMWLNKLKNQRQEKYCNLLIWFYMWISTTFTFL